HSDQLHPSDLHQTHDIRGQSALQITILIFPDLSMLLIQISLSFTNFSCLKNLKSPEIWRMPSSLTLNSFQKLEEQQLEQCLHMLKITRSQKERQKYISQRMFPDLPPHQESQSRISN